MINTCACERSQCWLHKIPLVRQSCLGKTDSDPINNHQQNLAVRLTWSYVLQKVSKKFSRFKNRKLFVENRPLYWGLRPLQQLRSYHGGQWRICVSWLSHTSTNTTFLSKATDYFSHMLLQRWEAKICRKEKSPQPGIELTTTRSWVWHAHHWATRAGRKIGQKPHQE